MPTTYTFSVREAGALTASLSPTMTTLMSLAGVAIAVETITEISAGFYKFDVDWSAGKYSGVDEILFVIDATATITADSDRYIEGRLERTDTVSTSDLLVDTTAVLVDTAAILVDTTAIEVDTVAIQADATIIKADVALIKADAALIKADTAAIQVDTTAIEVDTNAIQSSLGTLSTDVSTVGTNVLANFEALAGTWTIVGNQMIMKTAAGVVIRTFDLFDAAGAPATTQVFTRQYVS